jgi:hypothetical protein
VVCDGRVAESTPAVVVGLVVGVVDVAAFTELLTLRAAQPGLFPLFLGSRSVLRRQLSARCWRWHNAT